MAVSVTYAGDTYTGDFAIRGSDFVRVYDDKGVLRHSFTGIQQTSLFTITGTVGISAFDVSTFETYNMFGKYSLYFSENPSGVSLMLRNNGSEHRALKEGMRVVIYTSVDSFETFILSIKEGYLTVFMTEKLYKAIIKTPGNLGSFVALAYAPGTSAIETPGNRYAYTNGMNTVACALDEDAYFICNIFSVAPITCEIDANGRGQYVLNTSTPPNYIDWLIHAAGSVRYEYTVTSLLDEQGDPLLNFINVFVDRTQNNITFDVVCTKHSATVLIVGHLNVVWG